MRDNTVVSPLLAMLARHETRLAVEEPVVLSRGGEGLVVRVGDVVLKVHEAGTDEGELWQRLVAVMARSDVFLQPLSPALERCGDRLVTRWPHAEVLRPDDASLPWVEAATLLGRLHAESADAIDPARALPVGGGPRRVLRAVAHLRAAAASLERTVVLDAFATLGDGDLVHARADRVVHGDFHLGQLVTCGDGLRFIDVAAPGRVVRCGTHARGDLAVVSRSVSRRGGAFRARSRWGSRPLGCARDASAGAGGAVGRTRRASPRVGRAARWFRPRAPRRM